MVIRSSQYPFPTWPIEYSSSKAVSKHGLSGKAIQFIELQTTRAYSQYGFSGKESGEPRRAFHL